MANWQQDMALAAARLSFPEYEYQEGDVITLHTYYSEGYYYSEYTYDSDSFDITVSVSRNGHVFMVKEYWKESAGSFLASLMAYEED